MKVTPYINPQTVHFCNILGIKNNINCDGEVVDYGDPNRRLKTKYTLRWNTPDYTAEAPQDDDDGFV